MSDCFKSRKILAIISCFSFSEKWNLEIVNPITFNILSMDSKVQCCACPAGTVMVDRTSVLGTTDPTKHTNQNSLTCSCSCLMVKTLLFRVN